jgi:hypothetical protein
MSVSRHHSVRRSGGCSWNDWSLMPELAVIHPGQVLHCWDHLVIELADNTQSITGCCQPLRRELLRNPRRGPRRLYPYA